MKTKPFNAKEAAEGKPFQVAGFNNREQRTFCCMTPSGKVVYEVSYVKGDIDTIVCKPDSLEMIVEPLKITVCLYKNKGGIFYSTIGHPNRLDDTLIGSAEIEVKDD
jgi:hypothetical protein